MRLKEFKDIIINSNPEEWVYDDNNHQYIYSEDIRISIRISDPNFFNDENLFDEEWVKVFSNEKAYFCLFYLCFNGEIIENFYTVSVDGIKCFIPYPDIYTNKITKEEYKIALILNDNMDNNLNSLDSYLNHAQIEVQY